MGNRLPCVHLPVSILLWCLQVWLADAQALLSAAASCNGGSDRTVRYLQTAVHDIGAALRRPWRLQPEVIIYWQSSCLSTCLLDTSQVPSSLLLSNMLLLLLLLPCQRKMSVHDDKQVYATAAAVKWMEIKPQSRMQAPDVAGMHMRVMAGLLQVTLTFLARGWKHFIDVHVRVCWQRGCCLI